MTQSLTLAFVLAACADSATPPAAPTNLVVVPLGVGAHLTWSDNSSDEIEFVIMRQEMGVDPAMVDLAAVPFNGTQYHDEPVTSGATYLYQVIATNDGGEAESNQVVFVTP